MEVFEAPVLVGQVGHLVLPVGDSAHEALPGVHEPLVEAPVANPRTSEIVEEVDFDADCGEVGRCVYREGSSEAVPSDDQIPFFEGRSIILHSIFHVILNIFVGFVKSSVDFAAVIAPGVALLQEIDVGEPVFDVPWQSASKHQH